MHRGILLAGLIGGWAVANAEAASPDNPYRVIAEKNGFRLNPPPPPVVIEPPKVEEKTNLRFTGLAWDGDVVSAWLVVEPLESGSLPTYLSLTKGEKAAEVEVVSIDEATRKVKVNYRGKSLDLEMQKADAAPVAGARALPGRTATAVIPGVRGGAVANPPAGMRPINNGMPAIPNNGNNFNSRQGTQRQMRTPTGGAVGSGALANPQRGQIQNDRTTPMTAEESIIAVEVQRATQPPGFPPLPPTPLSQ